MYAEVVVGLGESIVSGLVPGSALGLRRQQGRPGQPRGAHIYPPSPKLYLHHHEGQQWGGGYCGQSVVPENHMTYVPYQ